MEPIRLEIFLDDKTAAGIGSASKGLKGMEQVGNLALQSLQAQTEALRAKIEQLNAQGIDTTAERAQLEELKKSSAALTAELEKLRKAKVQNNETPTVKDDPAPKLNNLRMSFTQIARELPSLTMGPQMFFLAISNNIPMVQDALAQARKEHDMLVESGKKATPVWRQVVSSLLSWQTALAVGITLLVMYGKEIGDFFKDLINGSKQAKTAKEAISDLNKELENNDGGFGTQVVKLKQLQAEWKSLSNLKDQKQWIRDNQSEFHNLNLAINNTAEADRIFVKNTDKVIEALKLRAQATAASKLAEAEYSKAMVSEEKARETRERQTSFFERVLAKAPNTGPAASGYHAINATPPPTAEEIKESRAKALEADAKKYNDAGDAYFKLAEEREKKARELLQKTGIEEWHAKPEKVTDPYNSILEQQERIKELQEKASVEQVQRAQEMTRQVEQAEIDALEDGIEKKLRQKELDHRTELEQLEQQKREYIQKIKDEARKQFEAEEELKSRQNKKYHKQNFDPGTVNVDTSLFDQKEQQIRAKQKRENDDFLKNLFEDYKSFEQRRKELAEDTEKQINALKNQTTEENFSESLQAIERVKKAYKKGLEAINSEEASQASKDSPFLRKLFGDYSEMAYQDLKNLMGQARQLQDYLNGTGNKEGITFIAPDQLAAIEQSPDDLDRLRKALKQLLQEGEKGDKWTQLLQRFKKGLEDLKNADDYKDYARGISEISTVAGEAAGALAEMAENMGAAGAAQALGNLQTAMSSISAIGEGFAKGGILGGVMATIGETAKLFAKGAAEERKHQEALEALMEQRLAQQRAYNLLLMEQNLEYEKADTVFGSDPYGKAVNSLKAYKQAISELKQELHGDGKADSVSWWERLAASDFTELQKQIALKDQYAGLADVQIKTGSYTTGKWFWKKQHDKYGSVLDEYPELLDAQGNFNKELAQTILDTREMSDESRAALENFINLAEKQEEALSVMKDYLTDIFGELGGNLSDALTDAFRNGSDAAQEFEKSVVSMLEGLAQQMAYSVTLAPLFEQASEKMLGIMKTEGLTPEEQFKQYTDIIADTMDKGLAAQNDFNRLLEAAKKAAAEKGLDLFLPDQDSSGSSQTASVGGYAALTQEQGTKLEGLFTGVYDRMVSIHSLMVSLQKDRQADSRLLAQIAENTAYCRYLLSIYEMMERMDREGITVR